MGEHLFSRKEFRTLNKFKRIYILVSGGLDSTYTVLNMWELRFWIKKPVILLHTDTRLQLAQSVEILRELEDFTAFNWDFEILSRNFIQENVKVLQQNRRSVPKEKDLEPSMSIVIDSLHRLNQAKKLVKEGKYSKKVFPCCYWLKHKPFYFWLRKENHSRDVFVSSIRGGESQQRQLWLSRLRKYKTKFHFHIKTQVWYYYPLRDLKERDVFDYFINVADKRFLKTSKSACKVCPIVYLFGLNKDSERYKRTEKVVNRLGIKV